MGIEQSSFTRVRVENIRNTSLKEIVSSLAEREELLVNNNEDVIEFGVQFFEKLEKILTKQFHIPCPFYISQFKTKATNLLEKVQNIDSRLSFILLDMHKRSGIQFDDENYSHRIKDHNSLTRKLLFDFFEIIYKNNQNDLINDKALISKIEMFLADEKNEPKDIFRVTFILSDDPIKFRESFYESLAYLKEKGIEVNQIKNSYKLNNLYKGVNCTFVYTEAGFPYIFEIQFQNKKGSETKILAHKIYDDVRLIPECTPEKQLLQKQLKDLYSDTPNIELEPETEAEEKLLPYNRLRNVYSTVCQRGARRRQRRSRRRKSRRRISRRRISRRS
jgi:hypothetical protein